MRRQAGSHSFDKPIKWKSCSDPLIRDLPEALSAVRSLIKVSIQRDALLSAETAIQHALESGRSTDIAKARAALVAGLKQSGQLY